jgi:4-hydroxy-3-polyprenylbenzoate decarboxylase
MKVAEDLREYIEILEQAGELRRVTAQVDWNLEIGAITRRLMDRKGPAPLFENIKDYPGHRLLACPFGPSEPLLGRLALALGLDRNTHPLEMVRSTQEKLKLVKPVVVADAPCKENVLKGDDVNVLKFPVPFIHGTDGGRYIGTWCIVVTRDRTRGWTNWGVYRVMVQNEKIVSMNFERRAQQHGSQMFERHLEANDEPYDVAIVVGADPISLLAATMSPPEPISEVEVAGGLRGAPVKLVKCETVDLEVPASAEIVIEGKIGREEMWEGPMGEFSGYTGGGKMRLPYVQVTCITHRNNPIVTLANMGKPWDDCAVTYPVTYGSWIRKMLQDKGLPVKDVFVLPVYGLVVSVNGRGGSGVAHAIIKTLRESRARGYMQYAFIVGEDIDISSMEDVFWCFTTRLHPKYGIHVDARAGAIGSPLLPNLMPDEREHHYSYTCYFDCTWPSDWSEQYLREHTQVVDFERAWPKDVQEKVLRRWKEYRLD